MPEAAAWPRFCKAIGRTEWLDDPRFVDGSSRYRHMQALVAGVDEALAAKGRDEWGEIFDREGLIWGPVLALHEVVITSYSIHYTKLYDTADDRPALRLALDFNRAWAMINQALADAQVPITDVDRTAGIVYAEISDKILNQEGEGWFLKRWLTRDRNNFV